MSRVDTSGIVSQHKIELNSYLATPPDVDQVVESVVGAGGASNGVIEVRATSPAQTAFSFEYDIDGALTWGNTTGIFTGLAGGDHTVQARDADTPANVSIILTINVPA